MVKIMLFQENFRENCEFSCNFMLKLPDFFMKKVLYYQFYEKMNFRLNPLFFEDLFNFQRKRHLNLLKGG